MTSHRPVARLRLVCWTTVEMVLRWARQFSGPGSAKANVCMAKRRGRNTKMQAIRRRLRQEYQLKHDEAESLADDVVASLAVMQDDIGRMRADGNWAALADAACALTSLGLQIDMHEVRNLGFALQSAADTENVERANAVARSLGELLGELDE